MNDDFIGVYTRTPGITRIELVSISREEDDLLDLAVMVSFKRPTLSCGFTVSDWFDNIDWNNAKNKDVISRVEQEKILKEYGKNWKGRIKFFNKQARAWAKSEKLKN